MNARLLMSLIVGVWVIGDSSAQECCLNSAASGNANCRVEARATDNSQWIVHFKERSYNLEALMALKGCKDNGSSVREMIKKMIALSEKDRRGFSEWIGCRGGAIVTHFWLVNACVVDIPGELVGELAKHREVRFIEPNRAYKAFTNPKCSTGRYNHAASRAHTASPAWTGLGVNQLPNNTKPTIAIVGGGLDTSKTSSYGNRPHKAFFPQNSTLTAQDCRVHPVQTTPSYVWVNTVTGAMASYANDPTGHETMVASIAAGVDWLNGADDMYDGGQAPGAMILAYNMLTNLGSSSQVSSDSTQMKAWEAVLADKLSGYNILVAVMSYGGGVTHGCGSQMALDLCAALGDIVIVVPSGNHGEDLGDTQYCANGLVVGCVQPTTKTLPPADKLSKLYNYPITWPLLTNSRTWSGYGVMDPTSTQRFQSHNPSSTGFTGPTSSSYSKMVPDLVAIGFDQRVAMRGNETNMVLSQGTSLSAPHVAGAALLFRAGFDNNTSVTAPTALEARAALLASSENIASRNVPGVHYHSQLGNGVGAGFLRTDRLTSVGTASNALNTATVVVNNPVIGTVVYTQSYNVTQGDEYSFAIAWFREYDIATSIPHPDWPTYNLEIIDMFGNSVVTTGLHETVRYARYTATATGPITVNVILVSNPTNMPTISFGYASYLSKDVSPASGVLPINAASVSYYGHSTAPPCTINHAGAFGLADSSSNPAWKLLEMPDSNMLYTNGGWQKPSVNQFRHGLPLKWTPYRANGVPPGSRIALPFKWSSTSMPNPNNLTLKAISLKGIAGSTQTIDVEIYGNTDTYDPPDYYVTTTVNIFKRYGRPYGVLAKGKMKITGDMLDHYAVFDDIGSVKSGWLVFTPPEDFHFMHDFERNYSSTTPCPIMQVNPSFKAADPAGGGIASRLYHNYSNAAALHAYWVYRVYNPVTHKWEAKTWFDNTSGGNDNTMTWDMKLHFHDVTQSVGIMPAELYFENLPKMGSPLGEFKIRLRHGLPGASCLLQVGTSPQDILHPATGCSLLCTNDILIQSCGYVSAAGSCSGCDTISYPDGFSFFPICGIPANPALIGITLYCQFVMADAVSTITSNGGAFTFGW